MIAISYASYSGVTARVERRALKIAMAVTAEDSGTLGHGQRLRLAYAVINGQQDKIQQLAKLIFIDDEFPDSISTDQQFADPAQVSDALIDGVLQKVWTIYATAIFGSIAQ